MSGFDYSLVESPDELRVIAGEIRRCGTEAVLAMGHELIKAKAMLPHGQFERWVDEELGWAKSTATDYVRIARQWGKCPDSGLLNHSVLLKLSARNVSEEARVRAIEIAKRGRSVTVRDAGRIISELASPVPQPLEPPTGPVKHIVQPGVDSSTEVSDSLAGNVVDCSHVSPPVTEDKEEPERPTAPNAVQADTGTPSGVSNDVQLDQLSEAQLLKLGFKITNSLDFESLRKLGDHIGRLQERMSPQPAEPEDKVLLPFDPSDAIPPGKLNHPQFLSVWRDWCQYNAESGKPLTETIVRAQFDQLKGRSLDAACAALRKPMADREFRIPAAKYVTPKFTPPTTDEVRAFIEERSIVGIDPEAFVRYYAAQGWVLRNGQKMKDWQSAVWNWRNMDKKRSETSMKTHGEINGANKPIKLPEGTRRRGPTVHNVYGPGATATQ